MASVDAGPPPYAPDIVFHMTGTIEGGAEAMFCMLVQMPTGQKTAVPSAESHYTPGSHHFLVFRSNLTSIPEGAGVSHLCGTADTTVAVAGGSNGIASAESVMGSTGSYYEAQVPDSRRDLPPGVAHVFAPGEILILTAHYLNTTEETIDSTIEFRLHLMDPADVKEEAGTFFLLNTQLNIPPGSEVTTTRTCPMPKDINLGILWSHMHARGWAFRAWTDDPVAMKQLGGDVYDQPGPDGWAEPHVQNYPYDPPVTIHAGSNLIFSCTYHNMTDQTFTFGQSAATAEMCLLHGMYWPRQDMATERCTNGTTMSDAPMPLPAGGM
jgi:copper type II ascorbate-dependent monooxygenase-like protein